jgi:hypothetical protein
MKGTVALLLMLCSFPAFLSAEIVYMPALTLNSTRSSGLGGPHVAYTNDIYALFVNPAALQWANQGSFFELSAVLTGPLDNLMKDRNLTKLITAVKSLGKDSDALGDSLKSLLAIMPEGKLPVGFELRGPISVGYTANGLGVGLFSQVSAEARIIGGDFSTNFYGDMMLDFGMAFNFLRLKDHEISAGFVVEPFMRVMSTGLQLSALEAVTSSTGSLFGGYGLPLIMGGGADLGILYRWKKDLALGIAVNDAYTAGFKVSDVKGTSPSNVLYQVKPALNVGIAYTFRLANVWESAPTALQSFYVAGMVDWHSLQNVFTWNDFTHRNPILDIGAGMEIGLFNFLKLRLGMNEMLPSVGLGLEPGFFKFNLAVYGKEFGNEPGQMSTMAADFSISLRPDTKKKTWPWSTPLIK